MINKPGAAASWWRELNPPPDQQRSGTARATMARLRRCATVAAAMHEAATIDLFRRVQANHPSDLPIVALTAAVLAHVRTEDRIAPSVARLVGPPDLKALETALLKPIRFRRVMEAATPDERLAAFRRLAALARGTLPVDDLATSLLDWTEDRRRRWVYAYWDAGPAPGDQPAPAATTEDTAP